jgi:hypothetical protein
MVNLLEATFPGLAKGNYSITSPRSKRYNCIAFAAGDTTNWWWPGPSSELEYWPANVPSVETLDAFRDLFTSLGYVECQTEDVEAGLEKIAVYAGDNNDPRHSARQLPHGRWTSKLGLLEDIEHELRDLEGTEYGRVVLVMKRQVSAPASPQSREGNSSGLRRISRIS